MQQQATIGTEPFSSSQVRPDAVKRPFPPPASEGVDSLRRVPWQVPPRVPALPKHFVSDNRPQAAANADTLHASNAQNHTALTVLQQRTRGLVQALRMALEQAGWLSSKAPVVSVDAQRQVRVIDSVEHAPAIQRWLYQQPQWFEPLLQLAQDAQYERIDQGRAAYDAMYARLQGNAAALLALQHVQQAGERALFLLRIDPNEQEPIAFGRLPAHWQAPV